VRAIYIAMIYIAMIYIAIIATLASTGQGLAQKLVDPNAVAPEFREAAEKRRAQQIRILECRHKADVAKVLPRDRTDHINHCLEAGGEK
jgi:hypothetical protein